MGLALWFLLWVIQQQGASTTLSITVDPNTGNRLFYIDWNGGSNSNPGTKALPWKSHPYMQHNPGCTNTGSAPVYSHVSGDQFIFKGGVSWPANCFVLSIPLGGTNAHADYYGVDHSWFTGGSWTRPKWDFAQHYPASGNNVVITAGASGSGCTGGAGCPGVPYLTFDNIEIANPLLHIGGTNVSSSAIMLFGGQHWINGGATGVTVENMYLHDWATTDNATSSASFSYGAIYGASVVDSIETSDQNGYAYLSGTKTFGVQSGGCVGCGELKNSLIHHGWIVCSSCGKIHDNESYHIDNNTISGASGIHTHAYYQDGGGSNPATDPHDTVAVYNNFHHDSLVSLIIAVCYNTDVYNNVVGNSSGNASIEMDECNDDSSGAVGNVYNNTLIPGTNVFNESCYRWGSTPTGQGTINLFNNQCVPSSGSTGGFNITHLNQGNNVVMTPSQATSQGYTAANNYAPTLITNSTVHAGADLSSHCSGLLASLCFDITGFARPSGNWDAGAYQFH